MYFVALFNALFELVGVSRGAGVMTRANLRGSESFTGRPPRRDDPGYYEKIWMKD